jgi:hypothetical protein
VSPSGLESFERHADVISARRSSSEFIPINYFGIKDGETARVRFLEQGAELTWAISHRIKTPGLQYPQDVLCLDQEDEGTPCPACQSDIKEIRSRSTKGYVNIIWRGTEESPYLKAPVYKLNDKGFVEKNQMKQKIITGFEDGIFLWKCSKTVFENLLIKDQSYKGIMSRDFVVSRKGAEMDNTSYAIEPAVIDGGPEPMTPQDAVLTQKKFNIAELTTPGSYENMVSLLNGQQIQQQTSPRDVQPNQGDVFNGEPVMRSSAFAK